MSDPNSDLAIARNKLHALGDKAKLDFKSMVAYLRLVRELGVRDSEGVAEYGSVVLKNFRSKLQEDEMWQLYEDVALAAADTGCLDLSAHCVQAINKNFPSSIRAKRLCGMLFESGGRLEDAKAIYDEILQQQPTNAMILKRKVGLALTTGDLMGAIDQLVAYLDIYQTDRQGWEQLSEMYTQARLLDQARFCAEEALVHGADTNSLLRVADLLYAQGGATNLQGALGYFCKVIELSKGGNARALYGALGTVCELDAVKNYKGNHSQLATMAAQKLLQAYELQAPAHVEHVRAMLEAQRVQM